MSQRKTEDKKKQNKSTSETKAEQSSQLLTNTEIVNAENDVKDDTSNNQALGSQTEPQIDSKSEEEQKDEQIELVTDFSSEITESSPSPRTEEKPEIPKTETPKAKPKTAKSESKPVEKEVSQPISSSRPQDPVKNKKSFSWLAFFAFILSLLAVAAAGYLYWQYQLWFTTQAQVQSLQQQSAKSTEQNIQQLQLRLNELQQKQLTQSSSSSETQQNVDSLTDRVKELGQAQPNYWLAAESLYLVNLAERRLLIEQDVTTAIELLVSANIRLASMKDPSVFPIQQAISEDVAKLQGAVKPEKDAIYLSLSGVISEVKTLPFANVYLPEQSVSVAEQTKVSSEISDWKTNLKSSLIRFFDKFVDIRRNDVNVGPTLPADQQWFVRANLTTQILMAQSAVLEQNDAVYKDALKQSKQWLLEYFNLETPQLVAVVTTLEELEKKNVDLNLPTSLVSQPVLNNYVQTQLSLRTGETSSSATETAQEQSTPEAQENQEAQND